MCVHKVYRVNGKQAMKSLAIAKFWDETEKAYIVVDWGIVR